MQRHLGMRNVATLWLLSMLCVPALAAEVNERAAIESAAQQWTQAYNERDLEAMLAVASDDIVLLDPSLASKSGKSAARAALAQALDQSKSQLTNTTKEIVVSGDVAWRIATLASRGPSGALHSPTFEIWRLIGGSWKLHRQMSSGFLAKANLVRPRASEPMLDTPRH